MKGVVLTILTLLGVAVANVSNKNHVLKDICVIKELKIDSQTNEIHKLKMGQPITAEIKYTPYFKAEKLRMSLNFDWDGKMVPVHSKIFDDACSVTTCPTKQGKVHTIVLKLGVPTGLIPNETFEATWKLWNEEDEREVCSLKTKVQFVF